MRERGWREAGVTDAWACGFGQDFGADGGVGAWADSARCRAGGSDADGGVGAGWTRRSVGPDEWCLRRGERL